MNDKNSKKVACYNCKNIRPNDFAGEHCAIDGRQVGLFSRHYCDDYVEMEPPSGHIMVVVRK